MPQFDQGSFLNQVIWFLILFLNSYFLITYFFLPIICENLKFRKKKIIENTLNNLDIIIENLQQNNFLNNSFKDIFNNLNHLINTIRNKIILFIIPFKGDSFKNIKLKKNLKDFYMILLSYKNIIKKN